MSVINNLKINIHRHSEGNVMTEESTAMYSDVMDPSVGVASLKDDNRASQRGRSMVEMLGVLAIVGVLSVGGVYGYGVASKKIKANELLHQASINAVQIASQIATGKESGFGLENFGTSNGTFNQPTYDKSTGKFTMKITDMDSAVCEQMGNMAGGILRDAKCDGTTLTLEYYGNLATNDTDGQAGISGGGSSGESGSTGGEGGDTEPSCTLTATDCPGGVDVENCVCESSEGQTCDDHTSNQCGLGYYCKFSPKDCDDTKGGNPNGVCKPITGGDDSSGHWVGPELDWWSANSWCIGKGSTGSITYSTLQSAYSCNKSSYSCDWSALRADGLSVCYWSAENYVNSCTAWFVMLDDVDFYHIERHYTGCHALCE